jgi:hypothetical protein
MTPVFLAGALAHGFGSWAQLWLLCEFHHGFLMFNFDHFEKFSALGPVDRQNADELFKATGLESWMRETSADWGTLLFGKFRQRLIDSLGALSDGDFDPAVLPRLAQALHLTSQYTVELAWGRDVKVDALAPEKAFPRGNKENQMRELRQMEESLKQAMGKAEGRLGAVFAFLLEIWRFGQAQKTMQELEAQRTRCQNALTVLAGQPGVEPAVVRDLKKLIGSQ